MEDSTKFLDCLIRLICFVYHKLVTEIDGYGHPYHENNEKQQKLIENHGFAFIRC